MIRVLSELVNGKYQLIAPEYCSIIWLCNSAFFRILSRYEGIRQVAILYSSQNGNSSNSYYENLRAYIKMGLILAKLWSFFGNEGKSSLVMERIIVLWYQLKLAL